MFPEALTIPGSGTSTPIDRLETEERRRHALADDQIRWLAECFKNQRGADVNIIVRGARPILDDRTLSVASFFVTQHSSVWAQTIADSAARPVVIEVDDFDFETIAILAKAMYTGLLELNADGMFTLRVLAAAKKFGCERLHQQALRVARDTMPISVIEALKDL